MSRQLPIVRALNQPIDNKPWAQLPKVERSYGVEPYLQEIPTYESLHEDTIVSPTKIMADTLLQVMWDSFRSNGYHMIHQLMGDGKIYPVVVHDITSEDGKELEDLQQIKDDEYGSLNTLLEFMTDVIKDNH